MTAEHDSAHAQRIQIIWDFRFQLDLCRTRYVRGPLVSTSNRFLNDQLLSPGSLPVRQRKRRDPSQDAAKTLPRESSSQ
jgi:hypothetical protein